MRCSEAAPAGKKEALSMAGAKKRAKKPVGRDRVLFNILSYAVLTALSAACLLPFLLVLSGSVSEQYSIQLHGYRLFPETISLDAYKMLFRIPQELLRAYGVTIFVTAVGTVLGLWLTSMAAYVLSSRDFRYRYQVSFFFYFTSIFGGGLVPWYIFNTKYLHFHNSVIALILPIVIGVFPAQDPLFLVAIGATLGGAVYGDHVSPISDTTILSSAGAQCNHLRHVATQLPYASVVAAVCLVGYIIAGFTGNPWIALVVGAVLMIAAVLVLNRSKYGAVKA